MIESSIRRLSEENYSAKHLDDIIEAFVAFYGEEEREHITQTFRNTQILEFSNPETLKHNMDELEKNLLNECFSIPEDKTYYFYIPRVIEIFEKKDADDMDYFEEEERVALFDGDTDTQVIIDKLKNNEYPKVLDFLKRYEGLSEFLKPYQEFYEEEKKKEEKIKEKYYKQLVEEFKYLIPQADLDYFEKFGFPSGIMYPYFGYNVSFSDNCFDEDSERELNDPNGFEWRMDNIKKDRIKFLEQKGFNLKDREEFKLNEPTYEDYLNDPECRKAIEEAKEIFARIKKRKQELNRECIIETVTSSKDYQKLRAQIDQKGYVDKDDPLGPFVYCSSISCCSENYVFDGQNYIFTPLVLINLGMSELDITLIHELNHAYEGHTLHVDEKGCSTLCGWEYQGSEFKDHQEITQLEYKGITRSHELMSEYVNDRIAQEITDLMHNSNHHIYEEKRKTNFTSSYMSMKVLLEPFYQEFKSIIIKSRSHGNISHIYEMLGQENFEALNDLTNYFYDTFGFGLFAMEPVVDYLDKKDTEGARKVAEFVEKRNEILVKMREHLQSKEITRQ